MLFCLEIPNETTKVYIRMTSDKQGESFCYERAYKGKALQKKIIKQEVNLAEFEAWGKKKNETI
jgi:hypothetical protein